MDKRESITTTTCPFCGVGCRLELHVRDNQISHVTTPYDDLVSKGNLCVKGRFGWDFLYHPDRVLKPLIRKTPQRPGHRTSAKRSDWREASWEEALELVTARFAEIIEKYGPDSTAVFCCAKATNEDNYALQKLFRAVVGTNNIDHCTRLCHAGSVVALQMAVGTSAMSNSASDIYYSDVAIVTGSNTAESHPIIALQFKDAIKHHGTKLIVADPRRVEMVNFAALGYRRSPLFGNGKRDYSRGIAEQRLYRQTHRKFRDVCQSDGRFHTRNGRAHHRRSRGKNHLGGTDVQ